MPPECLIDRLESIYDLRIDEKGNISLRPNEDKKDNNDYRNSKELTMLHVMSNRDNADKHHVYYKRMAGNPINNMTIGLFSIRLGKKSVCLGREKSKKYEKFEVKKSSQHHKYKWFNDTISEYAVLSDGQQFIRTNANESGMAYYSSSSSNRGTLSTVNNYEEENRELRRRVDRLQEQLERLSGMYVPQGTIN